MKTLFVISMVFLGSISCFAEDLFLKAGVLVSDGTLVIGGGEKSITFGATFGLSTEFELWGLDMGAEMLYVQKGITSKKQFEDLAFSYYESVGGSMQLQTVYFGPQELTYKYRYEYVEFPFYAIVKPVHSMSVYAGLSFSFLLKATLYVEDLPSGYDELTEEYLGITMSEQEINGYTNKTDFQILGGLKYSYKQFFIDMRYSQGLSNIANEDLNKDSVVMRYASVCLGVKL